MNKFLRFLSDFLFSFALLIILINFHINKITIIVIIMLLTSYEIRSHYIRPNSEFSNGES